jgi:4-hydroxybenzoate polyprenyltransferase
MRPNQWTKNLILFAGVIFAHELFDPVSLAQTVVAFFLFCFLSSAIYIINDIKDVDRDRQHPLKSKRPIAAGELSIPAAWMSAVVLVVVVMTSSFALDPGFGLVASL